MKIVLRRHAPTRGNLETRYAGFTDESLAPEGVSLAQSVEQDENVGRVFVSALKRARETAEILYPNASLAVRPDLNEMNFGDFENQIHEELVNDDRYLAWLDSLCETPCPGGESKASFTDRCRAAFSSVLAEAGDDDVHMVVHGGVIMSIMSGFVRPEREYFSWHVGYCEGYVVEPDGDGHFRLTVEIKGAAK